VKDGESFTQIIVSQLGAPRDYTSEIIGGAIVLLVLLAYVAFEYSLVVALRKLWRIITTGSAKRNDQP